jgi:hypothetical protein
VVHLGGLIDPQDRGIGTSSLKCRLNPRDRLRIDKIVSAVHSINVRRNDDFVPWLHRKTIVQKVVDRQSRASCDSYSVHTQILSLSKVPGKYVP